MVNPYDPQSPANPNYFGGRQAILAVVKERLDKALVKKQSGGVLVYGYRGVGKSSLLAKITSLVSEDEAYVQKAVVVYRRLSKTTSDTELYQIITETVAEHVEQRKSVLEKLGSKISHAKMPCVEFSFDERWKEKTPYFRWVSFVQTAKDAGFVLVALDDADYLSTEALSELKTIVEGQAKIPVLLVVSGGIEFEERLVEDYSPVSRIFSGASFNIGEFELNETREALARPVAGTSTSWAEDAVLEVQKLSRGYPYLVQCLASASYSENAVISADKVRASSKAALDIGKPWFNHELGSASDNDILSFLKITKINKPVLKSSDMQNSGVAAPYIGRLVQLKVLKQISRGRYIVQKAPMIAYYHAITRGISSD
jgi:hypothetical protein